MYLLKLLAALFGFMATAMAVDDMCNDPFHPRANWCGHFTHHNDTGKVGCLYANDRCQNFAWSYPGDRRGEHFKTLPVFSIANTYCGFCFVFEKKNCQGQITYMGGPNATTKDYPSQLLQTMGYPAMEFSDSLSYFCKPPGWHFR